MRGEEREKAFQVVNLGHAQPHFLQQPLEILFSRLLTVKADRIMQWVGVSAEPFRDLIIRLGFPHPLSRQPFHKGLFLST